MSEAARTLPPAHARRLAAALDRHPVPSAAARASILDAVPTLLYRQVARRLLDAWHDAPATPGPALALAVRAATSAATIVRRQQTVDIVWTGPVTDEVPVRHTRQVLLDVIDAAHQHLVLVSFAAYRVEPIVDALAGAAARGVQVDLVLETALASGGRLTVDAADAFATIAGSVAFHVWPAERRPVHPTGGLASLHAKAAIADDHTALVTSANLTGSAIGANMELGLLVRGGPVPRRLAQHFQQLIADGVLEPVPPPGRTAP